MSCCCQRPVGEADPLAHNAAATAAGAQSKKITRRRFAAPLGFARARARMRDSGSRSQLQGVPCDAATISAWQNIASGFRCGDKCPRLAQRRLARGGWRRPRSPAPARGWSNAHVALARRGNAPCPDARGSARTAITALAIKISVQ